MRVFFGSLRPHCLVSEPLILTSVLFASVFSIWRVAGRWPRYSRVRPWRSLFSPGQSDSRLSSISVGSIGKQKPLHHPMLAAVRSPDITSGWAARVAGRGPLTGWLARSLFKHEMLLPLIVDLCFTFVLFMQFLLSLQKGRREAQMWLELHEWCAKKKKKKKTSVSESERPSAHYLLTLAVHAVQNWRRITLLLDQYGLSPLTIYTWSDNLFIFFYRYLLFPTEQRPTKAKWSLFFCLSVPQHDSLPHPPRSQAASPGWNCSGDVVVSALLSLCCSRKLLLEPLAVSHSKHTERISLHMSALSKCKQVTFAGETNRIRDDHMGNLAVWSVVSHVQCTQVVASLATASQITTLKVSGERRHWICQFIEPKSK